MTKFKCDQIPSVEPVDLGEIFFEIGSSLLNKTEPSPLNPLAALWFALGTIAGNGASKMNLGLLLGEGRGVPQDIHLSVKLLKQLADSGDKQAKEVIYFLTTPDNEYQCECCRNLQVN